MASSSLKKARCFLCRKQVEVGICIATTVCPASKKNLMSVLEYLASITKTIVHIARDELVCLHCHEQLINFDITLSRVMRQQRKLSQLVEKAACAIDDESDWEQECDVHMSTLKEMNDEHCFDDVDISDDEILQTVNAAMGNKDSKTSADHIQTFSGTLSPGRPAVELFSCNLCAMRFKSKFRLHKHIGQAHKKYSCANCTYSHSNEDYIMLHMNIHEGRPETQCRFCEKNFTTKISTIRHMEVHMDTKKYQCDKCGLCFSQTTVLYNHKLQHEAEEKPLNCSICNQIFKTKRTYRHHMITHREDRPRYNCEYCEKTFTEKYTLKVHKRTHAVYTEEMLPTTKNIIIADSGGETLIVNAITEAKHSCIICCRQFTTKDQQNKHMEKEHDVILKTFSITSLEGEEKKPCNICGHMFSTQNNLDLHMKDVHDAVVYQ